MKFKGLTPEELVGKKVCAKIKLHNYRFPRDKEPVPGAFAIAVCDVQQVIEGVILDGCTIPGGGIVITGEMPKLEGGLEYIFTGEFLLDPTWGPQYKSQNIRLAYNMEDKEDQKKFLSFFMTPLQIKTLYDMCENPIELFEQKNIGALTKIKGIGPATANRMCIKYAQNIDNGRAYVELKGLGLTKNAIDRLIVQFGSADVVVDLINDNPYLLITVVRGYGWERADKIALAKGFTRGCKERCMAYVQYKLEKIANDDGNSRMAVEELMADVADQCSPTPRDTLAAWIKEKTIGVADFEKWHAEGAPEGSETPLFYYDSSSHFFGLYKFRLLEKQISEEIYRLKNAEGRCAFDREICERLIKQVETEQGYTYTSEQRKAIWAALDSNVSILTGSAGTGKSSTLKPLIRIFNYYHMSVAQCALSGRASSLLTEYTGLAGKTIHRLLAYLPELERFTHNKSNPLLEDVIILDEASMVGEELFYSLISSIRSGAKLLMLGDVKQLPPISVGNLLQDCIRSGYIPTTTLTVIQRQALRSGIVSQSIQVCDGKQLVKNDFSGEEIRGELKDFKIITSEDAMVSHAKAIEEFKRLYFTRHISADDIQIVVPVRSKGINSCRFFNAEIQNIVNNDPATKGITVEVYDNGQRFDVTYKPGDRVMITKNNYHARNFYGGETAIFNGNLGHIVDIDHESMIIKLNEDDTVIIPRDEWTNVSHSWAATAHKIQGAQAPYVIVSLDKGAYPLLMREWLYTAITRARKFCALVGQPGAINTATRVSNLKIKRTWLKDDLTSLYKAEVGA